MASSDALPPNLHIEASLRDDGVWGVRVIRFADDGVPNHDGWLSTAGARVQAKALLRQYANVRRHWQKRARIIALALLDAADEADRRSADRSG